MKKIFVFFFQAIFTLALTLFLARCLMTLGPVSWLLQTKIGLNAHLWLLKSLGMSGTEDALDTLVFVSMIATLPPSILVCGVVTKLLRKINFRG